MPQIDWVHFTPYSALLGGLLIGVAASALLLVNGRILGVSGIIGGLVSPRGNDVQWRIWFIAGMLVPPILLGLSGAIKAPVFVGGFWMLAAAGLLVGFGTRMGSGCTSGHGICGIARLSPRSLAATAAFMMSGFLTVYLVRHML